MDEPRTTTDEKLELISFEIAGQEFCIDIRAVREIRGWTAATPIPPAIRPRPERLHRQPCE